MDTCRFNVFHYTHYMDFFAVANGVNFGFLATVEEMINEDLITWNVFQQAYYRFFYLFFIDHDPHSLSAQYIAWAHQNRISYFVSYFNCFINCVGSSIAWVGDL